MIDLNEIKELCDKATPGPWEYDGMHNELIARARTLIPELCDEVERLRAALTGAMHISESAGRGELRREIAKVRHELNSMCMRCRENIRPNCERCTIKNCEFRREIKDKED